MGVFDPPFFAGNCSVVWTAPTCSVFAPTNTWLNGACTSNWHSADFPAYDPVTGHNPFYDVLIPNGLPGAHASCDLHSLLFWVHQQGMGAYFNAVNIGSRFSDPGSTALTHSGTSFSVQNGTSDRTITIWSLSGDFIGTTAAPIRLQLGVTMGTTTAPNAFEWGAALWTNAYCEEAALVHAPQLVTILG